MGVGAGACADQRHRLLPSQGPLTPRLKPQKGRVCKIVTSQVWGSYLTGCSCLPHLDLQQRTGR